MATGIVVAQNASPKGVRPAKESKDAIHLSGNLSKLAGDIATVTVGDGSADVVLLPATTYMIGVKPASRADLQIGDAINAVVVRASNQWQAQSVKITHPKK